MTTSCIHDMFDGFLHERYVVLADPVTASPMRLADLQCATLVESRALSR